MTKRKKKLSVASVESLPVEEIKKIPIENLPEKFLWMHIKNGSKIRNVLKYALDHFQEYNTIVWSAAGQGIGKGISCAEIFKRKHSDLHQLTKLRYIPSQKSSAEVPDLKKQQGVPEIHILLSKNPTHANEPGYQAPQDVGEFLELETSDLSQIPKDPLFRQREQASSSRKITSSAAEEFAAMGLRTGQKRSQKEQLTEAPFKKNKKKGPASSL